MVLEIIFLIVVAIGGPIAIVLAFLYEEKKKERRKRESEEQTRIMNKEFFSKCYHNFKADINDISELSEIKIKFPENDEVYYFISKSRGEVTKDGKPYILMGYPTILISKSRIILLMDLESRSHNVSEVEKVIIYPSFVEICIGKNSYGIGLYPREVVMFEFLIVMFNVPVEYRVDIGEE